MVVRRSRLITMKRLAVNRCDKPACNRLKSACHAQALVGKETYYNDMAENAELALNRNDMKPIYRAIKLISGIKVGGGYILPKKSNGYGKSEKDALL